MGKTRAGQAFMRGECMSMTFVAVQLIATKMWAKPNFFATVALVSLPLIYSST